MHAEPLYRKYSAGRHWEFHPKIYAERFLDFLKKKSFHGLILDVGCGNGRDMDVFSQKGFSAIGIDIDEQIIRRARERFPKADLRVGDAQRLALPDGSIGACFMINVIHYLNQSEALAEIWRVLRPGGFLFIHFNLTIVDRDGHVDYHQDYKSIRRLTQNFRTVAENEITRHDRKPIEHTHTILELMLQK